jgi:heme A synthase
MAIAEHLIWPSAVVSSAEPARAEVRTVRFYFLIVAALGLGAVTLGVANRLTPGLFPIAPPVDVVPPLGDQAWYGAFVLHQQDPVFAACGGSETLVQFKVLYWWEWLRQGSLLLLAGTALSGFFVTALWPAYRFALQRHVALGLIGLGYVAAGWCLNFAVAHVEDLARYNVGQYRHALDLTFASIALALVAGSAIAPPTITGSPWARPLSGADWIWIGLIILDVCFGALFASRDAITVWRGFPGYEAGILPPLDRLTAYEPLWLNFTFNQYMIQFVHRMLSIGLWVALIAKVISAAQRSPRALAGTAMLFALFTSEMGAGIATLVLGASPAASFLHEVSASLLLAVAVVVLSHSQPMKPRTI